MFATSNGGLFSGTVKYFTVNQPREDMHTYSVSNIYANGHTTNNGNVQIFVQATNYDSNLGESITSSQSVSKHSETVTVLLVARFSSFFFTVFVVVLLLLLSVYF